MNDSPCWPHAPQHRLGAAGTCFVTGATYQKAHVFRARARLDSLQDRLLALTQRYGWVLEAWAVFSNHYHFVAHSPESSKGAQSLSVMVQHLHTETASAANDQDQTPGRKIWHNYWETKLTFEKSYYARLSYTHQNAVHHRLTRVASAYPWCSAAWFEKVAKPGQVRAVYGFKIDRVRVPDEFVPEVE